MDTPDQAPKAGNEPEPSKTVTDAVLTEPTAAAWPADPRISTTTGPERRSEDAPEVVVPPAPPTDRRLALGDSLTVAARAEISGKIRLLCSSMSEAGIVYPGQVAELRWVEGKVRLSIRTEAKPTTELRPIESEA